TDHAVDREPRLRLKRITLNPTSAANLHYDRLQGPFTRCKAFGLKRRRSVGAKALDVSPRIARIQFAHAIDVPSGANTEAEVGVIGPISLIVVAAIPQACEIRNLIMLEAGAFQHIHRVGVITQLGLLVECRYLAALALLP